MYIKEDTHIRTAEVGGKVTKGTVVVVLARSQWNSVSKYFPLPLSSFLSFLFCSRTIHRSWQCAHKRGGIEEKDQSIHGLVWIDIIIMAKFFLLLAKKKRERKV